MVLPPRDFESRASTNSAIPAKHRASIYCASLATASALCFCLAVSQQEGGIIRRNQVRIKFGYNSPPRHVLFFGFS